MRFIGWHASQRTLYLLDPLSGRPLLDITFSLCCCTTNPEIIPRMADTKADLLQDAVAHEVALDREAVEALIRRPGDGCHQTGRRRCSRWCRCRTGRHDQRSSAR